MEQNNTSKFCKVTTPLARAQETYTRNLKFIVSTRMQLYCLLCVRLFKNLHERASKFSRAKLAQVSDTSFLYQFLESVSGILYWSFINNESYITDQAFPGTVGSGL